MKTLCLLLLCSNHPGPPVNHRAFRVLTVVAASFEVADNVTTLRTLAQPGGYEQDPLFGRHPSAARLLGTDAAIALGWYLLARHEIAAGHPHRAVAMMGASAALEGWMTIHNLEVPTPVTAGNLGSPTTAPGGQLPLLRGR